jgi:hypothetical protein
MFNLKNSLAEKQNIYEFEIFPEWMIKAGQEQFTQFGFEYGHHGNTLSDGKPYFGKMLYLLESNHDTQKPHVVMNVCDAIKYNILPTVDPEGTFEGWQRIAVNGQLPGQSPEKHVDSTDNELIWTAVYYATDSDGDTVFYQSNKNPTTEVCRSTYKQGKIVLFPGRYLHQAHTPTQNWRVSIGISFMFNTKINKQLRMDR